MPEPTVNQDTVTHDATSKRYDPHTGLLQGFDIRVGANEKPLHVDLQYYSPAGKTVAETNELRETYSSMYQAAIEKNPEDAQRYFTRIADHFPNGIAWHPKGNGSGADIDAGTLHMQGTPNPDVMKDGSYGHDFIRLHGQVSAYPFKTSEREASDTQQKQLQAGAAAINAGDYFNDAQKARLNTLVAEHANSQGLQVIEIHQREQQANQSVERSLG